jgi:hypothetical protein
MLTTNVAHAEPEAVGDCIIGDRCDFLHFEVMPRYYQPALSLI